MPKTTFKANREVAPMQLAQALTTIMQRSLLIVTPPAPKSHKRKGMNSMSRTKPTLKKTQAPAGTP
jgi:hypothetical protein